jgi:hypothetical protein
MVTDASIQKNSDSSPLDFAGFRSPNYTIVPDELFDRLLAILTGAEIKVLLYIIRRTFGFKKDADSISFNQICNGIQSPNGQIIDRGTGLATSTAQAAVKRLVEHKIIVAVRNRSLEGGDEPTTYKLNVLPPASEAKAPPVTENRQRGLPKIDILRYRKSVTQETIRQETETSNNRMDEKGLGESRQIDSLRRTSLANGFQPVGQLLPGVTPQTSPRTNARQAHEVIGVYVQELAEQLGDEAILPVSVARMVNLYRKTGISLERYLSILMEARSRTREAAEEIKKRQNVSGPEPRRKNQFPYFVAVVEDLLGLRNQATHDAPQTTKDALTKVQRLLDDS